MSEVIKELFPTPEIDWSKPGSCFCGWRRFSPEYVSAMNSMMQPIVDRYGLIELLTVQYHKRRYAQR